MCSRKKKKTVGNAAINVTSGQRIVRDCLEEYGKYVLEERAVPDYRDGLKPVQRRLLFSLFENGYFHSKSPKKSADVVGYTLGKYHPHGDQACYSALVNMVNWRYPVVEGSGNWGTIGGDPPAAYRYTECRLYELAHWIFDCMEVSTYAPNYDDTRKEPIVLPSRLPMFFMNGSEGIAVGIRCCIPPFNLTETLDAMIYLIQHWDDKITAADIQKIIKAPDYGRGILLSTPKEVAEVYRTGEGSLSYTCHYESREGKDGVHEIVISSYSPQFNVQTFMDKCNVMANEGLIEYVYDATDRSGHHIIVGYKNSTILKKNVLPLLERSISYSFYVTRRGTVDEKTGKVQVKVIKTALIPLLRNWISYRRKVETSYLELEISKVEHKIAREEALLIAIKNIDVIANALKKPNTEDIIKKKLKLNDFQVEVIMGTTVRSLKKKNETDIKGRIKQLQDELKNLQKKLKYLDDYLIELFEAIKKDVSPDKRGTLLRKQSVEIKGTQSGGMYIISNGSNLKKLSRVTGNYKLSHVTKDGEGVTTVSDHGLVGHWDLMDIPDGDVDLLYRPIVGLVPYSKQLLVCLTNLGNVSVVEHPQDRDNYKAVKLRDREYVVKAIGISEGETLVAFSSTHTQAIPFKDLKVQRNNTLAHKVIPRVTKEVDIAVVGKDSIVINSDGKEVKDLSKLSGGRIFVVGTETYVDKQVKDRKATMRFLKKKDPNMYIPIM